MVFVECNKGLLVTVERSMLTLPGLILQGGIVATVAAVVRVLGSANSIGQLSSLG